MAFLSALRRRERIPELMDDPAIDPAEHRLALASSRPYQSRLQ